MSGSASLIEVGNLSLVLCRGYLGIERQAQRFPTLTIAVAVVGRLALIPHIAVIGKGVGDRSVEVFLVYEEMVAGGDITVLDFLYQMTSHRTYITACIADPAILLAVVGVVIHQPRFVHTIGDIVVRCLITDGVGIDEQVGGETSQRDICQSLVVEQHILVFVSCKVDGGHAVMYLLSGIAVSEYSFHVVVCCIHRLACVIGRSTVYTVAVGIAYDAHLVVGGHLGYVCGQRVMGCSIIGQGLAKVDVVIGIDGFVYCHRFIVDHLFFLITLIVTVGDGTIGKSEVAVGEVVVYVGLDILVLALCKVEPVEQIAYLTLVKLGLCCFRCDTFIKAIVCTVVAVDYLSAFINDGMVSCRITGGVYPAILGIAVAFCIATMVSNTTTGERTRHAEVVYASAQMPEERLVEPADGVAVTMECAGEAVGLIADGGPLLVILRRIDVAAKDEVEIVPIGYVCRVEFTVRCCHEQVMEVVQVVLYGINAYAYIGSRVKINLGRIQTALADVFVVDVHVFVLPVHPMVHHLAHTVVVGHGQGDGVRVGTSEVGLGVVGHVVSILIPVHRCGVVLVCVTVLVCCGILVVVIDFPSGTEHLVSTGCYGRYSKADSRVGHHGAWDSEVTNFGLSVLELQVDVHIVSFHFGVIF